MISIHNLIKLVFEEELDFKTNILIRNIVKDKVREAMERQNIYFDLENNDASGDSKR